jgi:hypothetical protein
VLAILLFATAQGSQPPAACQPHSAGDYFGLFEAKNDWAWSGGDQAASVKASNGATYWLMGDTVLGTEDPSTGAYAKGWRMVANSILVQRGCSLDRATATELAIPDAPNGDRYWAMAAVEHAGSLWVTAQRVEKVPDGFGFEPAGVEIAQFTFQGDRLVLQGLTETPSEKGQGEEVQYSGPTVVAGGHAYFYGYRHSTVDKLAPHAGYVARVELEALTRPGAWEYWTGSRWSPDPTQAGKIIDGQPSSAAIIDGTWVVLYKELGASGSKVHALTGKEPTGPFTSKLVMESPGGATPAGQKYYTYSPQLHPWLPLASGKTLVSISWNGQKLFGDTSDDADLYKPRFSEVRLP